MILARAVATAKPPVSLTRRLARGAIKQFDQLVGLLALLRRVTADNGAFDAPAEMIFQHLSLRPRQRRANGLNLRQDIDTVTVFLDHVRNATHLPFDTTQPVQQLRLVVLGQGASSGLLSYTDRQYGGNTPYRYIGARGGGMGLKRRPDDGR